MRTATRLADNALRSQGTGVLSRYWARGRQVPWTEVLLYLLGDPFWPGTRSQDDNMPEVIQFETVGGEIDIRVPD